MPRDEYYLMVSGITQSGAEGGTEQGVPPFDIDVSKYLNIYVIGNIPNTDTVIGQYKSLSNDTYHNLTFSLISGTSDNTWEGVIEPNTLLPGSFYLIQAATSSAEAQALAQLTIKTEAARQLTTTTWPTGADGPIVIANGDTATLPPGTVLDCTTLTIEQGGILQFAQGSTWGIIGCTGDLTLQGTIQSLSADYDSNTTISTTAPDLQPLSAPVTVQTGGAGGSNGTGPNHSANPGMPAGGGGGGAADSYNGGNASGAQGGSGGTTISGTGTLSSPGGAGASTRGAPGQPGNNLTTSLQHTVLAAGGGGGGALGFHGGFIYIKVLGELNALGGTFDVSGSPGGDGGAGGSVVNSPTNNYPWGGAGGGGGAGGNGGVVMLNVTGVYLPGNYNISGGNGGQGGAFGTPGGNTGQALAGQPGSAGNMGAFYPTPPSRLRKKSALRLSQTRYMA
jgi:hypothetical protein